MCSLTQAELFTTHALSSCGSIFRVDTSRGDEAPGAPVHFGSAVKLRQLRTREYLTSRAVPSKTNKRMYRLGLSKSLSKDAFFRSVSAYGGAAVQL